MLRRARTGRQSRRILTLLATLSLAAGCGGEGGEESPGGWAAPAHKTSDVSPKAVARERVGPCRTPHVVDGDTLDVDCGRWNDQVRMLQIDTPEQGQPGYREATRALAALVEGRDLYLVFEEPGKRARGNYGRLLAYVYTADHNVNLEMIRQGWSPFWTEFGEGRFAEAFSKAEQEAKKRKAGLWATR